MDRGWRKSAGIIHKGLDPINDGIRFFYGEAESGTDGGNGNGRRDELVSDHIYELYEEALKCKIAPERFWNYSIREISDIINSYQERENIRYKSEINNLFILADVTANRLGKLLGSNVKAVMPWDYFPRLFTAEKEQYEDKTKQAEYENYKVRRKAAIQKYNQLRREV